MITDENSLEGSVQSSSVNRETGADYTSIWNRIVRRYILTRENAFVLLVALMILLIYVFGTMGVQPRFVYGGF